MAKTTSVASIGAALAELGQRVLLVDLDPQACLTFSLGIDPEDLELSIHHVLTKGLDPAEVVIETDDGVDLLPATIELARAEADLLTRTGREHVLKGALDDLAETDARLRLGPARLPAVARRAHRRRADRRRRRADPAAVRDAVAPRRRPAARHRARRTPLHQPRPRGLGRAADAVRRAHQPRAGGARDDLRDLRPRGDRAADPEDHQVRRGAGRRPVDPGDQPQQQGRRAPTARWPRRWSRGARRQADEGGADEHATAARPGRATAGSRRSSAVADRDRWSAALAGLGVLAAGSATAGGDRPARQALRRARLDARPRPTTHVAAGVRHDRPRSTAGDHAASEVGRPRRLGDRPPRPCRPPAATGRRDRLQPATLQRVWLVGATRRRAAHLPGLGQRDRQPRSRAPTRSTPGRAGPSASTTPAIDAVLRALHPGPDRRGDRLPQHPDRATACPLQTAAPAGHAAVARLHPAVARPTRSRCGTSRPIGTKVVVVA